MSPPPMGSPPFGSKERRAARRYDLSLPIVVRVVPHKRSEPCHAESAISCPWDLLHHRRRITPGAELEFTVALPVGITQGTKFLYTLTAGAGAEERREDDTTYTGVLPLSKGLSPSAPNLPYRKSVVLNQGSISVSSDFLPARTICGSRIVRDD